LLSATILIRLSTSSAGVALAELLLMAFSMYPERTSMSSNCFSNWSMVLEICDEGRAQEELLVIWIGGMYEGRSNELKEFFQERRCDMLFILSPCFSVLLSLRSSRPSLLPPPHLLNIHGLHCMPHASNHSSHGLCHRLHADRRLQPTRDSIDPRRHS